MRRRNGERREIASGTFTFWHFGTLPYQSTTAEVTWQPFTKMREFISDVNCLLVQLVSFNF